MKRIKAMYRDLRSKASSHMRDTENRFEEHQARAIGLIFNRDAYFKCGSAHRGQ